MKKLRTFLTISGLFLVPAIAGAQNQFTSKTEVKAEKNTEVKTQPVSKEVVAERIANRTELSTEKPAAKPLDINAIDQSIKELENKIESNKNNPDFKADAYEKRLKYLRERREEATKQ